jgi:hypothetical protein
LAVEVDRLFGIDEVWQAVHIALYVVPGLGAVGYRQAFKYMSAKGWRTNGEPNEPAFQPPELLAAALNADWNQG